jgi:parvulin-like peptidyl-prolyl isomerase
MLPPNKIRDYVGPVILRTLEGLAVGAWSDPIESGSGFYLAALVDREPRIVPNFEEVTDLVRHDLKRRRGDEALRRYLDDLRSRTPVAINESVFSVGK